MRSLLLALAAAFVIAGSAAGQSSFVNGDFESSMVDWHLVGDVHIGNKIFRPHTGKGFAYFGVDKGNEPGMLYTSVKPAQGPVNPVLSFWLYITSSQTSPVASERFFVEVFELSGNLLETIGTFSNLDRSRFFASTTSASPTLRLLPPVSAAL